MTISKDQAILSLVPNASFSKKDNVISQWEDKRTKPTEAEIQAKITELETAKVNEEQAKADLKASVKAKLIAGEPLTEEEADTIVL